MQDVIDPDQKTAVNLRIRASLKERARALGVNLSQTLEHSLEQEIRQRERQQWLRDNRQAVDAYNARIAETGPALADYRTF